MLTFLLACAGPVGTAAHADEGAVVTLRELTVESVAVGQWEAEVDEPGAVIVACESEGGAYTYGPSADPTIALRWSPTLMAYTISSIESVDCRLWLIK
jgi:hypothetical protein